MFEVAAIRPAGECANRSWGTANTPGAMRLTCMTVEQLIQLAYGAFGDPQGWALKEVKISGGPGWVRSERYEIQAKAEGVPTKAETFGPMLRSLLEDRFALKVHREARPGTHLAMTVAKGGSKLQPAAEGSCVPMKVHSPPRVTPGEDESPQLCGPRKMQRDGYLVNFEGAGMTMDEVAHFLAGFAGRPLVNRTGLNGRFDVKLEFVPEQVAMLRRDPNIPTGPSIFQAFEDQLGLKLEAGNGAVEVLVIDRVERPSAN